MDIKPRPLKPLPQPAILGAIDPDLVLAVSPQGGYSVSYQRGQLRIVQHGRAADGKIGSAALAGFTKAVELAAGRDVLFAMYPNTAAHLVKEAVEMMPNMTMGYYRQGPHTELLNVLPRCQHELQASPESLDVYTDASMGVRRLAGLGWVIVDDAGNTTAGCKAQMVPGGISMAELLAIKEGVKAALRMGQPERITVYSDSQSAVAWMNDQVTRSSAAVSIAAKIRSKVPEGTTLTVEWVRGHAGNIGNESADRMALAARRMDEAHLTAEQAQRMKQNIVEDISVQIAA